MNPLTDPDPHMPQHKDLCEMTPPVPSTKRDHVHSAVTVRKTGIQRECEKENSRQKEQNKERSSDRGLKKQQGQTSVEETKKPSML